MQETLFNPALWMPVAGFVVAAVVFIYGNARVQLPIRNAGLGVLGLVVAWCVAAYLVETRVEQCVTRTYRILAAVEKADWTTLGTLLDKNTVIDVRPIGVSGRDAIVKATEATAGAYGLKNITAYGTEASQGPNTIDVTFNALLEGAQPLNGSFRFEYEERSDGMLLSKIVPVKIGDRSMEDVQRAIR